MAIGAELVRLRSGDVVVIEPGESHISLESTPDYFHFVLHAPTPKSGDQLPVSRERLAS